MCGHDGHMTILCGLARRLQAVRPKRGRVILLFQPAEETGAGARGVIDDVRFKSIKPDFAFGLHNLPGMKLGDAAILRFEPVALNGASGASAIRRSGVQGGLFRCW